MQLPASLAHISVEQDWQHTTAYPPLGFAPFFEGALGNGDTFGLYWPIGREGAEPIVVETWHDAWRIQPHFSSLTAFLQAHAAAEDEYVATPSLADYPVLHAAMECYLEHGNYRCASTLMQTYAELMSAETVSFQERYAFEPAAFIARQIAVSARLPQGSRDPAALWLSGMA
jgi:hypothetical protein